VILRCLDRDPDRRPASALTVAVSLPGGDPLAAALAAGETPSPDMLAAAGESEALAAGPAFATVAFVVVGLTLIAAIAPRVTVAGLVPLNKPPAVLADRAQQILTAFGYTDPIADSAYSYTRCCPRDVACRERPKRSSLDQLKVGSPAALGFWYRTSPRCRSPPCRTFRRRRDRWCQRPRIGSWPSSSRRRSCCCRRIAHPDRARHLRKRRSIHRREAQEKRQH